jgi:hypothetical protein
VDGETGAYIGIVSSLVTAIGGYFVTREKVRRLEDDVHELKDERTKFVTFTHFDAVIQPLRATLDSVQVDIKVLLKMVAK